MFLPSVASAQNQRDVVYRATNIVISDPARRGCGFHALMCGVSSEIILPTRANRPDAKYLSQCATSLNAVALLAPPQGRHRSKRNCAYVCSRTPKRCAQTLRSFQCITLRVIPRKVHFFSRACPCFPFLVSILLASNASNASLSGTTDSGK